MRNMKKWLQRFQRYITLKLSTKFRKVPPRGKCVGRSKIVVTEIFNDISQDGCPQTLESVLPISKYTPLPEYTRSFKIFHAL